MPAISLYAAGRWHAMIEDQYPLADHIYSLLIVPGTVSEGLSGWSEALGLRLA